MIAKLAHHEQLANDLMAERDAALAASNKAKAAQNAAEQASKAEGNARAEVDALLAKQQVRRPATRLEQFL